MAEATAGPTIQEDVQEGVEENVVPEVRKKHLTNKERNEILQSLLSRSNNKKLDFGAISIVAKQYNVTRQTVGAIWKRGIESMVEGSGPMVVENRRSNCGRKKKDYTQHLEAMAQIPVSQRGTIRATAHHMGISTWAVWRMTKKEITRHTSAVKPLLSERQKQDRIDYAIRQIDFTRNRFKSSYDVVHVDEKWFDVTKVKKTYYLGPGEAPPTRATKSKRFIEKVMFLCAVARPRHDTTTNSSFDGKLGIWPFVEMVPAQRSSRNRPAGTLEMKNIVVTKEVYNRFICEKVIPAIQQKWPACHRNITIRIQQDNARPHNSAVNGQEAFEAAVAATGLSIVFDNQPAQSPDCNVLDLGYFNSIQSLQQTKQTRNTTELCAAVAESFLELDKKALDNCFLTHQAVCKEILKASGANDYKLPHMGKDRLRRQNLLPLALPVEPGLIDTIRTLRPTLPELAEVDNDDVGEGVAV